MQLNTLLLLVVAVVAVLLGRLRRVEVAVLADTVLLL
jgi:hypothetical protein